MPRSGHIALAGRPNVGKSSLLNTLVGEHLALVSRKAQATRLPVVGLRTEGDVQYVFHDLPGLLDPEYALQARMRALAIEGIARADLILQLHPAPEAPAPEFWTSIGPADRPSARPPVLIVYTKSDLIPSSSLSSLSAASPASIPVSATTGSGMAELLAAIAERLPEREFAYPEDELGTQPLRFFAVEFLREAAFEQLEDELPYAFTAEIEEFRETTDPVYIRASLFVERDSQKGILIGEGGRTLKAIGKHARERLEQLIGSRVFLETWVKVLPKWRRDPAQLRRFGFPDAEAP
ncbi:MAG TPA: GTPase Era [Gemmatimonadales bacterium]|jgi:GTP-binding protein Era|nr:GTPase Era [Gemmatimonadales bacterium]